MTTSNPKARRIFETVFISPPTLSEAEFTSVVDTVSGHFTDNGAEIRRTEKWGRKKLAYDIKKHGEGWYALLQLEGPGTAVAEVERRMRISDKVIRFQTVRLDDVAGAMEAAEERVIRLAKEAEERAVREAERAVRDAERAKAEAEREAERAVKEAAKAAEAAAAAEAEPAAEEPAAEEPAAEEPAAEAPASDDTPASDEPASDKEA
jgi:small subunit ribosomal protein S6